MTLFFANWSRKSGDFCGEQMGGEGDLVGDGAVG